MPMASTLGNAAASATGSALGGVVHAIALARRPRKPMHPKGRVRHGRLFRRGASPQTGVEFLDHVGQDDVLVRESNGIGLPKGWPDIHGLAVRIPDQGDLLFSTTGLGPWSRYLITLTRAQDGAEMTTLFPYATAAGPVILSACYRTPATVELAFARGKGGRGAWEPFADLLLSEREDDDPSLAFDAVLHTPPGLAQYDAVRRVRAASYRTARETR